MPKHRPCWWVSISRWNFDYRNIDDYRCASTFLEIFQPMWGCQQNIICRLRHAKYFDDAEDDDKWWWADDAADASEFRISRFDWWNAGLRDIDDAFDWWRSMPMYAAADDDYFSRWCAAVIIQLMTFFDVAIISFLCDYRCAIDVMSFDFHFLLSFSVLRLSPASLDWWWFLHVHFHWSDVRTFLMMIIVMRGLREAADDDDEMYRWCTPKMITWYERRWCRRWNTMRWADEITKWCEEIDEMTFHSRCETFSMPDIILRQLIDTWCDAAACRWWRRCAATWWGFSAGRTWFSAAGWWWWAFGQLMIIIAKYDDETLSRYWWCRDDDYWCSRRRWCRRWCADDYFS